MSGGKRDSEKRAPGDGVLGNLPATRPDRIGGRTAAKARPKQAATSGAAKPRAAATGGANSTAGGGPKAKASGTAKAAGGGRGAGRAGSSKPGRNPAWSAADAAGGTDVRSRRPVAARPDGPRAVRAGAPDLDAVIPPEPAHGDGPKSPTGKELVVTAVQAAGELAQIGLTVGGQALKQAARRFGRP